MSENRVLFVNLAVIAGCLLSSSLACAASPDDLLADAKYIWFFDTDVNGNGVLDVDDVRDVRDWGSTVPGSYAGRSKPASVSGTVAGREAGVVRWVKGNVVSPEQGVVDSSCYLDMVTITNGEKKTFPQGFVMPAGSAWKGSITAIARVNVASFTGWPMEPAMYQGSATRSWLVSNGYKWYSTGAVGFEVGFSGGGSGYNPSYGYLRVNGCGMNFDVPGIQMNTNVWYDVAWSVKFNGDGTAKASFVVIDAKNGVRMQEVDVSGVSIPDFPAGYNPALMVGGASAGGGALGVNDAARFSGRLSRLAVWDKALTQDELLAVMTQPRPWFELGTANGSGEEFGLEAEANYTYEIEKAPWHAMPRSLSSEIGKQALTLVVPYHTMNDGQPVDEFTVPYSFEVQAAADSGSATLTLTIQGKAIGEPQTISAGGLAKWYVPANTLTADDVAHTIVLTRTGGSPEAFVFDKISMTGSFAFGRKSWSTNKFGGSVATNYVGMRDMAYVNDAPNQDVCTVSHRFFVPADQANSRSYTVEAMSYNFGSGDPAASLITGAGFSSGGSKGYPYCLRLNGELIYSAPQGENNGTVFKVALPRGKMKAGWNTFSFAPYDDDFYKLIYKKNYWWMGFDYFKLSMSKEHFGGLLIVR